MKKLNQKNHVIFHPESFLEYLSEIATYSNDLILGDRIEIITTNEGVKMSKEKTIRKTYRIGRRDKLVTLIFNQEDETFTWIRNADLKCFIELFREYDISKIKKETFVMAYIQGLFSPYFEKKEHIMAMTGDFYELHIQFEMI